MTATYLHQIRLPHIPTEYYPSTPTSERKIEEIAREVLSSRPSLSLIIDPDQFRKKFQKNIKEGKEDCDSEYLGLAFCNDCNSLDEIRKPYFEATNMLVFYVENKDSVPFRVECRYKPGSEIPHSVDIKSLN